MFDWNDLRYFLAIAHGGSIGIAAKALGVNESTVQRRLRAREAAFDCSLAERQAGYRLTAHGQQLLVHAEQIEATVNALQRQSATLDDRATGLVKLTSHVTVGQRIVKSGFLDRFHSRHPGITVELIMEQRALDLSKGEADIAIRGGTLDGDPALVGRKIAEVPWGIYASHSFVERHGRPSTSADIDSFNIVELVDEIEALPASAMDEDSCADGEDCSAMQQCSQRTPSNQVRCRYRSFASSVCSRRRRACLRAWTIAGIELSNVPSSAPRPS